MKDSVFYLVLIIILYLVLTNIIDAKEKFSDIINENYFDSTANEHAWYTGGGNNGTKKMIIDSGGNLKLNSNNNGPMVFFPGSSRVHGENIVNPGPPNVNGGWDQNINAFFQTPSFNIGRSWYDGDIIHSSSPRGLTLTANNGVGSLGDFSVDGQFSVNNGSELMKVDPSGNVSMKSNLSIAGIEQEQGNNGQARLIEIPAGIYLFTATMGGGYSAVSIIIHNGSRNAPTITPLFKQGDDAVNFSHSFPRDNMGGMVEISFNTGVVRVNKITWSYIKLSNLVNN
jgi:hypothetical protein